MFDPASFFDLTQFQHRQLFEELAFVWEALPKIAPYLKSLPLGKIETAIPEGVHLVNREKISIGAGSTIEPGAYIRGPCILGANCTVRQGAYIRGDFVAGDGCVIGHCSEVKNALFLDGAHAAHFAYVGDSILGNRVNLGAGVKCANLKLANGLVTISYEGERIATGLRKLGAIIGDGTQLGCNCVTNPGTLLGRNVLCLACLNLDGVIAADQIVKGTSELKFSSRKVVS
jgi:NDP-sugar pyrophosphorylase family protein